MNEYLLSYAKNYKQYYKGECSFYEFVLQDILDNYIPGTSPNLYDIEITIRILVALLLEKERNNL